MSLLLFSYRFRWCSISQKRRRFENNKIFIQAFVTSLTYAKENIMLNATIFTKQEKRVRELVNE